MKPEFVRSLDTVTAADLLGVKPATLRHATCTKGHYFGLKPIKAPNGRLRWPEPALVRYLAGDFQHAERAA